MYNINREQNTKLDNFSKEKEMQMKNYAKIFVSFALAAALLLSMGNAAFAEEKKT